MMRKIIGLFLLLSCAVLVPLKAQILGKEQRGKASFYANKFNGRKTSNGERFSSKELTAAHRSFPFNTMVEVTNLANNKTIVVRVNDRGPYSKHRLIDLSREGAEQLGFVKKGVASVRLRVIGMEGMILLDKNEIITETGEIVAEAK